MTIIERARRKRERRERWNIALRALNQIKHNNKEAERLWYHLQDNEYFRLMDLNKILYITFEEHRYHWRDYLEEIQDALWVIM